MSPPDLDRVSAQHVRDSALRRITRTRVGVIAGSAGLTVGLAALVADTAPGKTYHHVEVAGGRQVVAATALPPLATPSELGLRGGRRTAGRAHSPAPADTGTQTGTGARTSTSTPGTGSPSGVGTATQPVVTTSQPAPTATATQPAVSAPAPAPVASAPVASAPVVSGGS